MDKMRLLVDSTALVLVTMVKAAATLLNIKCILLYSIIVGTKWKSQLQLDSALQKTSMVVHFRFRVIGFWVGYSGFPG